MLAPNSPSTAPVSGPLFQKWMRRAPRELNPRDRPRSHLQGEGRSSHAELAPTPECGAPRGPSVPHGACGLLSGEMGRGCRLLRGNPWAAFLGDCEVRRSSDGPSVRGAQGAKASTTLQGRHCVGHSTGGRLGWDGRRECVRACVCAPAGPGLGSLAGTVPRRQLRPPLSSRRYLGRGDPCWTSQRWPPTLWLNKSISHTSLASQAPAAAVAGVLPAPSPPLLSSPAPPPLLLALRRAPRCASALRSLSPLRLSLSFPTFSSASSEWGCPGGRRNRVVQEEVRSLDNSRARPPLGSPATCSSLAQVLARPPAPAPALAPAQPRIAVAC